MFCSDMPANNNILCFDEIKMCNICIKYSVTIVFLNKQLNLFIKSIFWTSYVLVADWIFTSSNIHITNANYNLKKRRKKNSICNKWQFIAYTWHRNQPLRTEETDAFQLQIIFLFKLQMNCRCCASTVHWLYVSNACYEAIIHTIVGFESITAL